VSVLVTGLLVGCGVLVGRLIARGTTQPPDAEPPNDDHGEERPSKPAARAPDLAALPCQLGDVVLRSTGEEAWLAGALVLRESSEVALVLFFSPEAGGDRAVLARATSKDIAWLSPAKDVVVSGDPPTALEAAGDRFERKRRLPLRVERIGSSAPDFAGDVIVAEYTGLSDEQLVVLASKEKTIALRGVTLAPGSYDVLPGKG